MRYRYRYRRTPAELAIRWLRAGCCNRPFYHIVVAPNKAPCTHEGLEQLGVYDPMPNERNEKLVSLNVERFQYWIANGARVKRNVGIILGLAGVVPLHPFSLNTAWKNRLERIAKEENKAEVEENKAEEAET